MGDVKVGSKPEEKEELAKIPDNLNAEEEKNEIDEAEDHEDDGDPIEDHPALVKALKNSTRARLRGLRFKRLGKPFQEEDYASWCKFFKEDVKIEIPYIQNPEPNDSWILFEFRSLEDKNKFFEYSKTNKYDGIKIRAETIKVHESYPERLPMPLEEALDILYPKRNTLYSDQLKEKFVEVKSLVEEQLLPLSEIEKLCSTKRYIKNIKTRDLIPLSPTEGYENNVLINVEKTSNGEVLYGMRAVDSTGQKNIIVPLDKCLSISRQTAIVAKAVVSGLSECGLEPFSVDTKEGNLIGFILRFSAQATFMLTVIVGKPFKMKFQELTPTGIKVNEGEELGPTFKESMAKVSADCNAKITKFFLEQGKALAISSVYLMLAPEMSLLFLPPEAFWSNMPKPEYVVGAKRILEKINNVVFRVDWGRERHTEVLSSVLSLFEPLNLTSATTVYLVSPLKEIGYYFAKKCGAVKQMGFWRTDANALYKRQAVGDGFKNIDYVHFNTKLSKPVSVENAIVVWWPFLSTTGNWKTTKKGKISFFEKFLQFNFSSMVFVTYWKKPNPNLSTFTSQQHTYMEKVYSKLRINKIIPFDLEPYRDGYGLFLYFKGSVKDIVPMKSVKKKPALLQKQGAPGAPFKKPLLPGGKPPFQAKGKLPNQPPRNPPPRGRMPLRGGMDPWDQGGRRDNWGQNKMVRHVSIADRLGPRPTPEPGWTEMDQVVGVVENLQSMAEQMQAFFDQSQQAQGPPSWSNKRKYPDEDFGHGGQMDREMDWQVRRGEAPGGGGYIMDYQIHDTKRRRGDSMERPIDSSSGGWGNPGDSRGPFTSTYGEPPSDWNRPRSPSWSRGDAKDTFPPGRGIDYSSSWKDNGRDSATWRDDGRNPPSWKDDERKPPSWKDDRRSPPSWKDDGRNPPSWNDEGREPRGWKDDGRNPSWKDDRRNSSSWKDDGRNPSSWKDDGRNPPSWKDDGRNTSSWKDDGRQSSSWKDVGRQSSSWKDEGKNSSGWKDSGKSSSGWGNSTSSSFTGNTGNSGGWRGKANTADWKGETSNWPGGNTSGRRKNDNPSPWEGSASTVWNKNNDPWASTGSSSTRNDAKGRPYY